MPSGIPALFLLGRDRAGEPRDREPGTYCEAIWADTSCPPDKCHAVTHKALRHVVGRRNAGVTSPEAPDGGEAA
ncbi:hypothetical protein [Streptomyces sp. NBC_00154]|uniref:hypothetical protein n=1 Tax=Streptomyces sp. NBC_00154 TaxID=2975670 RepID=UPI00224D4151|nr:hypothetical protein [Streptomyces sp. NBC_00154]MCX5317814.1 hypothetical protein [Streptomyces sp. NBC_00154]